MWLHISFEKSQMVLSAAAVGVDVPKGCAMGVHVGGWWNCGSHWHADRSGLVSGVGAAWNVMCSWYWCGVWCANIGSMGHSLCHWFFGSLCSPFSSQFSSGFKLVSDLLSIGSSSLSMLSFGQCGGSHMDVLVMWTFDICNDWIASVSGNLMIGHNRCWWVMVNHWMCDSLWYHRGNVAISRHWDWTTATVSGVSVMIHFSQKV